MGNILNYDDVLTSMQVYGLQVTTIETGRMRRCKVEHSREKKGWYAIHEVPMDNGDSFLAGQFGIWTGNDNNAQKIDVKKLNLNKDQAHAVRQRIAADKQKADAQRRAEVKRASKLATEYWQHYSLVGEAGYLQEKGINGHGLRYTQCGMAVVPMMDNQNIVYGLQFLLPKGHAKRTKLGRNKTFWPPGMEMRGKYHLIGGSPNDILLVAEGYATADSLHQASNYPVAVAFNAGNLLPVCENLQKRYPQTRLIVCGDDDYVQKCSHCGEMTLVDSEHCEHCQQPHGKNNAGKQAAQTAALAVDGLAVLPVFSTDRKRKKITDFNDLHAIEGLHVVQKQLEAITQPLVKTESHAPAGDSQSGGRGGSLKPLLTIDEAVARYSLVYGAGGTMFDHDESMLVPTSDVLDICPDHAKREWKLRPDRKVVRLREVGFDPTGRDTNIRCNLFDGWPTKPKQGKCDELIELLEYLCSQEDGRADKIKKSEDDETRIDPVFDYVLRWLAYPIQHPGAKMRTSLVFHGPQGVGKSVFFEAYAKIFGKYSRVVGQSEIDDKFNDWASGNLFMIADEVVARAELYHIKNKIKALITGETIRINPKNVAAHDERNHVNIVFLSNETQPLVLEKDDRRFVVIWVPEKLAKSQYKKVQTEIEEGGIEALHDLLLNMDLGDFNEHSPAPMTQSKRDLVELGLSSEQRFLRDWQDGTIGLPVVPALSEDVYRAYQQYCRTHGVMRPRELNQLIGSIGKTKGWQKERKQVFDTLNYQNKRQRSLVIPMFKLDKLQQADDWPSTAHFLTDQYFEFQSYLTGGVHENA